MNFLIFATLILILFCTDVSSFKQTSQEECSVCRCHNVTADCSNRNLSKVPVLRSNITRIFLSRNNFTTVTRNLFVNVKTLNITTIKLDYCNIKHVSTDTFADFQWLTHLNISGNKELSVQDLSAALVKTQLTELNLDDAGIEYMFVVVSPLRSIKTLSLKTNFIEKFNTSVLLNGFPSLRSLDLTNNRLETFPFTANLSQIEILNLTDNRIESGRLMFCLNGSDPSNKLKILNLSWNYLSNISVFKSEGHCLSHLERLILSNNYHIFKVPNNVFSRLPKIRNIRLKYVSERTDIEPLAFNVSTLIELHLTTNDHLNLQPKHINMFKLTPNLQTLHFTNVIFKNIADNLTDMFSHLVHMKDFKIKYGIVWDVSFLSTMTNLTKLDLLGNYLTSWKKEIFTNLPLKEITLSRNQIAVFDKNMFPSHITDNLEYFAAASNPLLCTCDLLEFKKWLATNKEKLNDHYPRLYTCLYPDVWKGKTIAQYEPDKNECSDGIDSLVVIGIGLGCLAGVLLLLAVIVYKGRYHIKHRLYLVRSLQPYQRLPDGDEFVYDAFVAHHIDNRLWVINHLLPFLEKQRKLRLCLHERDFLPGNFIADNIVDNINVSRKVILVFSRDFAKSEWCQFEATTAYQRILTEGTSSVVIIMLEDISHRPVNDTIRNLLDTITYIEWNNERNNRPEFFRKLFDALQ